LQHERLNLLRQKMESYGYGREWLDQYFWTILGSIDEGDNLGDRFVPPESWWRDYWESKGYEVKIQREPNYDGQGSDNLVFMCHQITDETARRQIIEAAWGRIDARWVNEPKNPNKFSFKDKRGYGIVDW
jgi:hypothetical protein